MTRIRVKCGGTTGADLSARRDLDMVGGVSMNAGRHGQSYYGLGVLNLGERAGVPKSQRTAIMGPQSSNAPGCECRAIPTSSAHMPLCHTLPRGLAEDARQLPSLWKC